MSYNVIAEIPGTDLKDEVVMVGMHRLLARGHRGHRQRRGCRLRARSHAPFAGPWTEASTDRAHWALERRRAGKPWLARLCRRAPWTRARRVGCSNGALAIRIQA